MKFAFGFAAIIVSLAILLGVYQYDQRKRIAQLNDQQQEILLNKEKCSNLTRHMLAERQWTDKESGHFANHYNAINNNCFAEFYSAPQGVDLRKVIDVNEGTVLGSYYWQPLNKQHFGSDPEICEVTRKDHKLLHCKSDKEFQTIVEDEFGIIKGD